MKHNNIALKRSESIKKIPDKKVDALEDKQFDLLLEGYQYARKKYKKKKLWPMLFCFLFFWLVLPIIIWRFYRSRLPEWKQYKTLESELEKLRQQRHQRNIWDRMWAKKNLIRTENIQEINRFYHSLIQSAKQYNARVDLFDYALDRQNKKLDPPFTVGELEQIELTFQRIYDELTSAMRLLELAEQNQEMDLETLLKDQYAELRISTDYISQTLDIGTSGQLIQELLILESSLRADIIRLTGETPSSSGSAEENKIDPS